MRSRIVSVAAVIIAVVGAALAGWLQPLDDALTDLRFAWSGRAAGGNIAIVDIDSKTLAAIGRWPLPRRLYGDAIDRLVGLGAAEIAFDVDFSAASTPEDDAALEAHRAAPHFLQYAKKELPKIGDRVEGHLYEPLG
jgi:CHASE2 domain-containing sensor protein